MLWIMLKKVLKSFANCGIMSKRVKRNTYIC